METIGSCSVELPGKWQRSTRTAGQHFAALALPKCPCAQKQTRQLEEYGLQDILLMDKILHDPKDPKL